MRGLASRKGKVPIPGFTNHHFTITATATISAGRPPGPCGPTFHLEVLAASLKESNYLENGRF
jgi:hypothetical protein